MLYDMGEKRQVRLTDRGILRAMAGRRKRGSQPSGKKKGLAAMGGPLSRSLQVPQKGKDEL